jgi:hypothetical protein
MVVTLVEVAAVVMVWYGYRIEWSGEKGDMLGQWVESDCAFDAQAEPIEAVVAAFRWLDDALLHQLDRVEWSDTA